MRLVHARQDFFWGQFRIPMRGYEINVQAPPGTDAQVPNPHEGL